MSNIIKIYSCSTALSYMCVDGQADGHTVSL